MAIVIVPRPPPSPWNAFGRMYRAYTFCFTGREADLARPVLVGLGGMIGVLAGALAGLILSLVTGPEVLTKLMGFVLGGIAGGLLATYAVTRAINTGACPCPPVRQGFCICVLFSTLPGTNRIVAPMLIWGCPASCGVLVPTC